MIGTFTGTGGSEPFAIATPTPKRRNREFNFVLWGTFVATIRLEKSFDGALWHPLTANGTVVYSFTAPCCETGDECEDGVQYRLNCVAFTSGVVNYRLSQ